MSQPHDRSDAPEQEPAPEPEVLDEVPSQPPPPAQEAPPPFPKPARGKEDFAAAADDLDGGNVSAIDKVVRLNRRTIGAALVGLAGICALVLIWASTPEPPVPAETLAVGGGEGGSGRSEGVRPLALDQLPLTYADIPEPEPQVRSDAEPGGTGPAPLESPGSRTSTFNPSQPADRPDAAQGQPSRPSGPTPSFRSTAGSRPVVVPQTSEDPLHAVERLRLAEQIAEAERNRKLAIEAQARANASPILVAGFGDPAGLPVPATPGFDPGSLTLPPGAIPGPASVPGLLPASTRSNLQTEKQAFATGTGDTTAVLGSRLVAPVSPFLLQAGHTIAASLITEINTDLPGRIVANVTENTYDSVTGQYLLIPQGSRLLGSYDSLVSNGQDRALMRWERLILPNGKSMALDGMLGVDPSGAAGVRDRVDYHLDRLVGAILLSTAITFSANLARNDTDGLDGFQSNRDLAADSIAEQSADVGARIVDRQLDIQPTIKIRQGARVRVLVEADLVLEPYEYEYAR